MPYHRKTPRPANYLTMRALYCLFLAAFVFSAAAADPESENSFNVREFGAAGDGTNLDSPSIDKAIDAAAQFGGGTVYFPAGTC
jgi:hypothetical protein